MRTLQKPQNRVAGWLSGPWTMFAVRKWILGAMVLGAAFAPQALQGRIQIERAQREFQARHFYLKKEYVRWPDCDCSPAPYFPKDNFYGEDLDQNLDLAVELVQDLADRFWDSETMLYDQFLDTPDGVQNIEGAAVSEPLMFDGLDFPTIDPESINRANVEQKFATIYSYIMQLKFIWMHNGVNQTVYQVGVDGFGEPRESNGATSPGNPNQYTSCDAAKQAAIANWNDGAWWEDEGGLTRIRREESSTEWLPTGSGASAFLTATRGRIYCDLRGYIGSGMLYLQVAVPQDGESNEPPVSNPNNTWKQFEGNVSGDSEYLSEILGDDMPEFTDGCGTAPNSKTTGWIIENQMIVFEPTFITSPDWVDCGGCGCGTGGMSTGGNSAAAEGLQIQMGVGTTDYDESAGFLLLQSPIPTESITELSNLKLHLGDSVGTIYDGNDVIEQIYSDEAVVNFTTISGDKYMIEFYHMDNAQWNGTLGKYDVSGSATPRYEIENPQGNINHVRLTETRDSVERVTDFEYNPTYKEWTITYPGGHRKERRGAVYDAQTGTLVRYLQVLNIGETLDFQEVLVYQDYAWGPELVERTIGYNPDTLTTTYEYYDDPQGDGQNYGRLKNIVEPAGRWERYEYDPFGRRTNTVMQFKDNLISTADSENRVVRRKHSVFGSPAVHRRLETTELLLDQVISRTYLEQLHGESRFMQCQSPSGTHTSGDNLTTVTTKNTGNGDILSVTYPDGTRDVYLYPVAGTTVVRSGVLDQNDNVVDGTETTTIRDAAGRIQSREVESISPNGTVLTEEETYEHNPQGYEDGSYHVDYLDGTRRTVAMGCCGVLFEVNREGVTNFVEYDSLKRRIGSTVNGISTTNILDSYGNVLQTIRYAGGSQKVLRAAVYDDAGRLTLEVNPLFGNTGYGYSADATMKTNEYHDGGVRIETYFQDGNLKEVSGDAARPMKYDYGYDTTEGAVVSVEMRVNGSGGTNEWTQTFQDFAGRSHRRVDAPASVTTFHYNNIGQLVKAVDPDDVRTLYQYNSKGEQEYVAVDMNQNGQIDFGGLDRITRTVREVLPQSHQDNPTGHDIVRVSTHVWDKDNDSDSVLASLVDRTVDGQTNWTTRIGDTEQATTRTETSYNRTLRTRTVKTFAPPGNRTVSHYKDGRLWWVKRETATGAQVERQTYTYDAHGRLWNMTDDRNGITTYGYNDADLVTSVTTPPPGFSYAPQVTTMEYDLMLRLKWTLMPDGTGVTNDYYKTGDLMRSYGSRTYATGYGYDAQGRIATLTNWSTFTPSNPQGARVTTWNYEPATGRLSQKLYNDGKGPSYTYTAAGRLWTRQWERQNSSMVPVTTTYAYGNGGDVTGISYNDDGLTSNVTFTYDRAGRRKTAVQNGMTTTYYHDLAGPLTSEVHSGGTLGGWSVTNKLDAFLRRSNLEIRRNGSLQIGHGYAYDNASRLDTVLQGSYGAKYTYLANSPLIDKIDFRQNSTTIRLTTQRTHDKLNRLQQIVSHANTSTLVDSHAYVYNAANKRSRVTQTGGNYWRYEYDDLGQVTAGRRYWADGTPVVGQRFEYGFDDIGNRTQTASGGDENGSGLDQATYTADSLGLNQYAERTVPGVVHVAGLARAIDTVTVNDGGTSRKGEFYHRAVAVDNSTAPEWQGITNKVVGTSVEEEGNVFVPESPEVFDYDEDGNLILDGRWVYTWDAENRLVRMVAATTEGPQQRIEFGYDVQGRRISKKVWDNTAGTGTPVTDLRFVYDGWNLIAEIGSADSVLRQYMWGLDLSGSEQGAGGVGGLVKMHDNTKFKTYFPMYDGNGNVTGLVDGNTGTVEATYEYGPFGEPIRVTGSQGKDNPFRFSTKFTDDKTDLVYYGYRYYNPSTGRWLSRDPIEEEGGINLYGFVGNDVVNGFDGFGLEEYSISIITFIPQKLIAGPDGYWYGGDGDPRDFSRERNSVRTRHIVNFYLDLCAPFDGTKEIPFEVSTSSSGSRRYKEIREIVLDPYSERVSTRHVGFELVEEAMPTVITSETSTITSGQITINISGSAKDPVTPWFVPGFATPSVDYRMKIVFYQSSRAPGKWSYSGTAEHDGFPSYAFHINDQLVHHHDGSGSSLLALIGTSDVKTAFASK